MTPGWTRPAVALLGLALAAATLGCRSGSHPADGGPDHVRAIVLPYLTMVPFHIAAEEGFFAERNLDVEFVTLGRNQEIMAVLAQGNVDVAAGMLTVNELSLAATGARVRMVAALGELRPEQCTFTAFVARREHVESGALTDRERLRTLRFDADLLIPFGYWIDEWLRPYDLTVEDLDIVNLPSPAAIEALSKGAIDVTLDSEPFLTAYREMPEAAVLTSAGELNPGYVLSLLMYGPTLLDGRPGVGERFMTAMLKGIRQYNLGKTPRNLDIVQRATHLSPDQVSSACWAYMSDEARLDPAVFRGYQAWSVAHGLLDRVLEDGELFDIRFIDHANAELGR